MSTGTYIPIRPRELARLGLSSNRNFWSATQNNSSNAYNLNVNSSSANVNNNNKTNSNSNNAIRCVAP
ncbi:hypothetical protein IJH97_01090 [Candidatus Saccharibacteria bacterium]|nr:hypothetical protein [Candidatus Saccharibacteria bacterium]